MYVLISGDLYQQTTRFVKNVSTKSYLTEEGSRGSSAAHAYVRAAHVARLLSQQEAHSLGGFLRCSESPERDLGKVKVISDVVDEGRVRHARGHRVDPHACLLYTSPSPRDVEESRMPSSA